MLWALRAAVQSSLQVLPDDDDDDDGALEGEA